MKVKMYSCKQTNKKTHEIKLLSITMCCEFLFKIHSNLWEQPVWWDYSEVEEKDEWKTLLLILLHYVYGD